MTFSFTLYLLPFTFYPLPFILYLLPFTFYPLPKPLFSPKTKEISIFPRLMESNPSPSLPQVAGIVLNDLRLYLSRIEPVSYQAPLELLSGSTIGQHTRHIIEFFSCLLEQSEDNDAPVINYSLRKRDYRIESEPDHALSCVDIIAEKMQDLNVETICKLDCMEHGYEDTLVSSTIGRELIYNIEHTIHHLAIVKIALKVIAPSIELPEHFGVAPSTIRHRLESCAQ